MATGATVLYFTVLSVLYVLFVLRVYWFGVVYCTILYCPYCLYCVLCVLYVLCHYQYQYNNIRHDITYWQGRVCVQVLGTGNYWMLGTVLGTGNFCIYIYNTYTHSCTDWVTGTTAHAYTYNTSIHTHIVNMGVYTKCPLHGPGLL